MSAELTGGWTVSLPMARPLARACPECGIPMHPRQSLRCICGYDPAADHSGRRAVVAGASSCLGLGALLIAGAPAAATLVMGLVAGGVALWGLHQARRGHRFGNRRAAVAGLLLCTGQLCVLVSLVLVPLLHAPSSLAVGSEARGPS